MNEETKGWPKDKGAFRKDSEIIMKSFWMYSGFPKHQKYTDYTFSCQKKWERELIKFWMDSIKVKIIYIFK